MRRADENGWGTLTAIFISPAVSEIASGSKERCPRNDSHGSDFSYRKDSRGSDCSHRHDGKAGLHKILGRRHLFHLPLYPQDRQHLATGDIFLLKQGLGQAVQAGAVLFQGLLGQLEGLI